MKAKHVLTRDSIEPLGSAFATHRTRLVARFGPNLNETRRLLSHLLEILLAGRAMVLFNPQTGRPFITG